jgi:hypothetical protein
MPFSRIAAAKAAGLSLYWIAFQICRAGPF